MGILTKKLVLGAFELSEPSILEILRYEGATWGPKWVAGYIDGPGLAEPIGFQAGQCSKWEKEWGMPADFFEIAQKKLEAVSREKKSTRVLVSNSPWLLKKEEFLYSGGVYYEGISVVASGAMGTTDEAISEIILANIKMLCRLKAEQKIKKEDEQIT